MQISYAEQLLALECHLRVLDAGVKPQNCRVSQNVPPERPDHRQQKTYYSLEPTRRGWDGDRLQEELVCLRSHREQLSPCHPGLPGPDIGLFKRVGRPGGTC